MKYICIYYHHEGFDLRGVKCKNINLNGDLQLGGARAVTSV